MFDLHVIQQNLGQSLLSRGHALLKEKEAIFRILVSCVACKSKEYKL